MERIEKYHLIIPYKTRVKLIYGNNNGKEGLVINKTYPRNGKYKAGNYHNYFQLTIQFEDNTKRATSCDYVEIIKEEIKVDYEKCWEELKETLSHECRCLNNLWLRPEQRQLLESLTGVIVEMKNIESKYQPKQYTWSEIIAMEPLPKKIKSCMTDLVYYNSIGGLKDGREVFFVLMNKTPSSNRTPKCK